jgi:hypothetical protein
MADDSSMDPFARIPEAVALPSEGTEASFSNRAAAGSPDFAAVRSLRARKPLRRKKQRLPVATTVDPEQVLTPADLAGPTPAASAVRAAPLPPSPAPAVAFEGGGDDGTSIPPDTMGVVNSRFVFNPLNNNIHILDRTGTVLSHMALDRFWDVFGAPMASFDPRAAYDPYGQRFLFTSTANAERTDSSLLIGVSRTDDPAGNWSLGFLRVDPVQQGQIWLDQPSIGFSADKITVQVNMYTLSGNDFVGSSVYVWDKDDFYRSAHVPPVRLFVLTGQGGTQHPAVTCDPGERTQYLVSRWSGNSNGRGFFAVYEVTGSVSSGTVALRRIGYIETPGVSWDSFVKGDFAPQPGTPQRIDTGDDRVLSVVYRKGSLWFSHTVFAPVGGPNRAAAQWLQVETGTWTVRQLGRVEDPTGTVFYAFPTLAVNSDEDALIGFSCFSASQFASGAYAYRAAGDPAGRMRTPHVYAPGGNTYFNTAGGSDNRWGDYSRTQVDPADDRSFWTIQEHASSRVNFWATRWAKVT